MPTRRPTDDSTPPGYIDRPYGALATICGRQADYAADVDRAWFLAHPGRDRYTRPSIKHEFCEYLRLLYGVGDICAEAVETEVIQIAPGARSRMPVGDVFGVSEVAS
jgi:hypothetical protein